MPDAPNPYEAPMEPGQQPVQKSIAFGEAIKRGFAAAHGALTGAVWIFFLMAPIQILGGVINAAIFDSDFLEQVQSGEFEDNRGQPPPEIFMLGGAGCLACLWLPLIFFGLPWVWGGTVGQVRDRLMSKVPESFVSHGKRYYGAMMLLFLLFIVAVIVISIPNAIVGQMIAATAVTPGDPMTGEQMRALSRHPGNIASSVVTGLLMAAAGTMINLVAYAIVARGRGIGDALGRAFSFGTSRGMEVFKLYLVYVVLILPLAVLQWTAQLLPPSIGLGVAIGLVSSLYIAYLGVVNFGLAGSLFEARADLHGDGQNDTALATD